MESLVFDLLQHIWWQLAQERWTVEAQESERNS